MGNKDQQWQLLTTHVNTLLQNIDQSADERDHVKVRVRVLQLIVELIINNNFVKRKSFLRVAQVTAGSSSMV